MNIKKKINKTIKKLQKDIENEENKKIKVCDHCHITGKFRGASHNDCNLKFTNYAMEKKNTTKHQFQ